MLLNLFQHPPGRRCCQDIRSERFNGADSAGSPVDPETSSG